MILIQIGARQAAVQQAERFSATHAVRIGVSRAGAVRYWRLPIREILTLEIENNSPVMESQVSAFLAFVYDLPADARLFIHCASGMTRSATAAIIAACALQPDVPPDVHYTNMLEACPRIVPNRRMIAHADRLLQLEGRLIESCEKDWDQRISDFRPIRIETTFSKPVDLPDNQKPGLLRRLRGWS